MTAGTSARVTLSCVPRISRGLCLMPLAASTEVACASCSMVKAL